MSDELDPIAQQYEDWPYPEPSVGLEPPFASPMVIDRRIYWPSEAPEGPLDVLVAGCGTTEAAIVAHQNRSDHIVGIDVSEASLRHERLLKMTYGLSNLTLHRHRIEDVAELGQAFDLILVHGVLHHLEDPDIGLCALRDVLKPHGSISIMLYGKHGRLGLEPVKQLLESFELDQTDEDAGLAQDLLQFVPKTHPAAGILDQYDDHDHKSGVIDLVMNRRDQDYSVEDCLRYLERCGLNHQRWMPSRPYYPDAHIPNIDPAYAAFDKLPEPELWRRMDLLLGNSKHQFLACRGDRDPATYVIDFGAEAVLDYVPWRPPVASGWSKPSLDLIESRLFSAIDGQRTIRELAAFSGFLGSDSAALEETARALVRRLWRAGLVEVRF